MAQSEYVTSLRQPALGTHELIVAFVPASDASELVVPFRLFVAKGDCMIPRSVGRTLGVSSLHGAVILGGLQGDIDPVDCSGAAERVSSFSAGHLQPEFEVFASVPDALAEALAERNIFLPGPQDAPTGLYL